MADKGKGKGKGKGAGAGAGAKGGSVQTGVVSNVDADSGTGQIQPDGDGEIHTFQLSALGGKEVAQGQKVEFTSSGKKGKREAANISLREDSGAQKEEGGAAEGSNKSDTSQKEEAAAPEPETKKETDGAVGAKPDSKPDQASSNKEEGKERTLRDDEDCFIADYTANKPEQKVQKFEAFASARKARISRDIVEEDPDVELRIRKEPNLEADELMSIGADDTVEVVGRCGDWVRLAGDDERWMLSVKNEIELVEVFSAGWGFGGTWGYLGSAFSSGAEKGEGEEGEKKEGGGFGGWGLGSLSSVSSYVPTGMLKSTVESVSKNIMAAGSSFDEDAEGKAEGKPAPPPPQFPRPPTEEEQKAGGKQAAESEESDLSAMVASVDKTFDKEVELGQGGLAPVRFVSQGINMVEGLAGWLGTTAKEQAKTVQETAGSINTDELMEKAWTGVKGGVQASSHAASSASRMVSSTASSVANTGAVKTATGYGKTVLSTVGHTVMSAAETVLTARSTDGKVYPNRELGGVLAIEISGVIIVRNPDVDEDEDEFCTDRFDSVAMVPDAIDAISLLVEQRFAHKVHLISVASPGVQAKMMRWLTNRSFYDKTGVSRDNVVFCRELDEKEDVCREKGISVMLEASGTGAGIASKAGVETVLLFGDGADASEATEPVEEGQEPAAHKWWKDVLDTLLPLSTPEGQAAAEDGEETPDATAEKPEDSPTDS